MDTFQESFVILHIFFFLVSKSRQQFFSFKIKFYNSKKNLSHFHIVQLDSGSNWNSYWQGKFCFRFVLIFCLQKMAKTFCGDYVKYWLRYVGAWRKIQQQQKNPNSVPETNLFSIWVEFGVETSNNLHSFVCRRITLLIYALFLDRFQIFFCLPKQFLGNGFFFLQSKLIEHYCVRAFGILLL